MRPTPGPRPALHLFHDARQRIQTSARAQRAGQPSGREVGTIAFRDIWVALGRYAAGLLGGRREFPNRVAARAAPAPLDPLRRLVLTDEVSRVLFREFAEHRAGERGGEETGWLLLGVRTGDEAVALATIPAGAERDAGGGHVRFNPVAQAFASRVVRQGHKQLATLGVVHTHPGSLRHPSDGDYRGDVAWVPNLRGGEGVFGIGTADARDRPPGGIAWQPAPGVQCLGELCLSWYVLSAGDRNYRALPVALTIGPDLALALRPVWAELENHAGRLDRLARQLVGAQFDVVDGRAKPALAVTVPLPDGGRSVRVLMEGKEVRYLLVDSGGAMIADFRDDRVDHGVFVMLAELTQ
jgi:proteasome lid subunit RPN8/RPN11